MFNRDAARPLMAELVVIVAGVLLALAAQAAFEEWTDRQRERAHLEDLIAEFRLNEERLLQDLETTGTAVSAADRWREGLSGPGLPLDSAGALYAGSINTARFDAISGALRSLIDSGDLGLIRNRELRAALAGWSDRTDEHRWTTITVDMTRGMLAPTLTSGISTPPQPALQLDRLMLEVVSGQQAGLLEPLRGITAMLEAELDR